MYRGWIKNTKIKLSYSPIAATIVLKAGVRRARALINGTFQKNIINDQRTENWLIYNIVQEGVTEIETIKCMGTAAQIYNIFTAR